MPESSDSSLKASCAVSRTVWFELDSSCISSWKKEKRRYLLLTKKKIFFIQYLDEFVEEFLLLLDLGGVS